MITPNTLTILRIVLALILIFSLPAANSTISYLFCIFLFTIASLTDLWDGILARKMKLESDFGKIVDPLADKILILGTFFAFVVKGLFSFWWILPFTIREILVTIVRFQRLQKKEVIAAEMSGKVKVVVQIVTIGLGFCFYLLAVMGAPEVFLNVLYGLLYIGLFVTNYIAIYSGIQFFRHLK